MEKPDAGDAATRQLILKTAGDFFAKYGLSKTTVDDIAKSVRMAKSSLYYYFKSKDEMFAAVLEKETEQFKQKMTAALQAVEDPREKIKTYVLVRMQCMRELLNMYNALRDDYLRHYEFIQKMRETYDFQERELMKMLLHEGNSKGIFNIKDISLTSYAIIVAIKGFEYDWAVRSGGQTVEKNMDSLLDVLFMGIVKR
ncbi:MAG TPA: TetR/AcrR family transcriptional regulator [Chitinivibrionales bacterium]|nr:TetR/AcrR family transcriptional regulator [Chitinivibrionales bacterium]